MRKNTNLLDFKLLLLYLGLTLFFLCAESQTSSNEDAEVMSTLKKSLNAPDSLGWSDPDPCKWSHVGCSETKRVIRIQIGHQNLQGTLPPDLQYLSELERLELQWNNISGPVPSLNGLSSLQVLMLSNNGFTSVPKDFFGGLTSLQSVEIDNNPFSAWEIPENLKNASSLQNFSANSANITGQIPGFLGPDVFPGLSVLHLAFNNLVGGLPDSFSGSQIQSLWVNGQKSGSKLNGGIDVVQNMTSLKEIWLHSNSFSGPLPDLSGLKELESLSLRDNFFTGPVPVSLTNLESLKAVNLTNNLLQGSVPVFKPSVSLDITKDSNSFCLPTPGKCDPKIDTLLSVAKAMSYPRKFAENWKGNDPCADWIAITCSNGFITIVNFQKMNLSGTIPPDFSSLKSLQRLVLANNNLTGTIPEELTSLVSLKQLDVSNNNLFGKVPAFTSDVMVNTSGNPDIGKNKSSSLRQGTLPGGPTSSKDDELSHTRETKILRIFLTVFGILLGILLIVGFVYWLHRKKQKRELHHAMCRHNATEVHPRRSGSDNEKSKATAEGSRGKVPETSDKNGIQMVEAGNLKFSIEVLRNVTNNFSQNNILGQGGFGTVYKGELHDGTLVAVKRMDGGVMSGKGSSEFQSEIDVLTTVRHRNLVSLLGYCLDGAEKLLVYEYMPQGTLTRHLLCWAEEGLNPLEWKRRLTIALDVAKGVEYLHSLAQKSFIHRDLKPSNILLGDDMRAKVSDFGLVRLAPEGQGSVLTRVAGTFGYLAPEYAVTGRITVKIDVYSFGVILMELITGRKALDETQPEDNMHLVTWFRRMLINEDTFRKAIDPIIDLTEETLTSVRTVSELAGHCTAREPGQRPEMAHAVNVLSSLVGHWKPSEQSLEDSYGIDLDMSLPQAVKKWQAYEGRSYLETSSSSLLPSMDNTQTSIPTRPHGFADSFTSADGR